MDKKPLIGVSLCAVVLLVLGSLTNCLRVESVQGCDCGDPPCWPELSGVLGNNSWYLSNVVVTFYGDINDTFYRIDGGNWTEYTVPFTLKTGGKHLLEWMCDINGTDIYSMDIKIDLEYPYYEYTCKWIGLFEWKFIVDAYDEASGVNKVWCGYTNSFDTEPPYEFIWHGCWWWVRLGDIIYVLLGGIPPLSFNVWDNAGHYLENPTIFEVTR